MRNLQIYFCIKQAAIFFAACFSYNSFTQVPYLEWANAHQSGTSWSYAICTDILDNVYTTGDFNGTVIASTTSGSDTIASMMGTLSHCFIQKTDSEGNIIWLKDIAGSLYSRGKSLVSDNLGNIYITGFFNGTADFNPSDDEYLVNTVSEGEIFVLKLSPDGEFIWARTMEGSSDICGGSEPNAIELDHDNNLVIIGDFCGTVDFDPGAGTDYKNPLGIFIQKLDTSGNLIWIQTIDPTSADAMTVDDWGNIFVAGTIIGTADFDPGLAVFSYSSTTVSYHDVYTLKLDSTGAFKWATFTSGNDHEYAEGIDVDKSGHVYVLGRFFDTVDFDPGIGIHEIVSIGGQDIFIQKLDSLGNFIWAKNIGDTSNEVAKSIKLDSLANIYICGHFYNTTDLDPGLNFIAATSNGFTDIFISKLDSSGNFIWGTAIGGISGDFADEIELSSDYSAIITGRFVQTVNFNPNGNEFEIFGSGFTAYIAKYKEGYLKLDELETKNHFQIYPNPATSDLNIKFVLPEVANVTVEVFDIHGRLVIETPLQNLSLGQHQIPIGLADITKGVYVVCLKINDEYHFQKFVKE